MKYKNAPLNDVKHVPDELQSSVSKKKPITHITIS